MQLLSFLIVAILVKDSMSLKCIECASGDKGCNVNPLLYSRTCEAEECYTFYDQNSKDFKRGCFTGTECDKNNKHCVVCQSEQCNADEKFPICKIE